MSAEPIKLVAYYRVSTKAQGRSGLGLDAQEIAVERYRANVGGEIVRTFTEIETGTTKRHRPILEEALRYCRQAGATLIVAKLDRLARNARFLLGIIESEAPVVFCDFPDIPKGPVGKMILTNMAGLAEWEAATISVRVKDALAGFKANERVPMRLRTLYGENVPPELVEATAGKLGASLPQCRNLTDDARRRGSEATAKKARDFAIRDTAHLAPKLRAWQAEGKSLRQIAAELNAAGSETRTRKPWSAPTVRRMLGRLATV